MGGADLQDDRLERIANESKVAVIAPGYRLGPENPYPAGHDDCEAAALWLANHAKSEFGTEDVSIGGESTGAYFAACTLLRMRDRHGYNGFSGANLVFGNFDWTHTPSVVNATTKGLPLHPGSEHMEWVCKHLLPDCDRRNPDISPIYANLSSLPPALFTVGTLDILLDDMMFMYARWVSAGNEADLAIYPGGTHGFSYTDIDIAKQANTRIHEFLRR